MSIFKREQEPPYNRAAAARSSPPVAPATQYREPAPAAPPTSARNTPSAPAAADTPAPPVPREAAAVVDRKTEITGTLHSSGNVLIEGRFHGEVEANETVWVEKGAQSDGQLRAAAAVISGAVDGQIECGVRLQIAASAVVSGEIKTPILVIEEGATVNCRFSMTRAGSAYGGKR
ncbi:MAG: bactofilin family protein [Nitrososphaerales archaeon]